MRRWLFFIVWTPIISLLITGCMANASVTAPTDPPASPGLVNSAPATETPTFTPTPTYTPTETPTETITPTPTENTRLIFDQFVEKIKNGNGGAVVGLYDEKKFALQVVQQPSEDAAYVSVQDGTATYFLMVHTLTGNHGFVAHNYLGGKYFFDVALGDIVQVVYGDGNYDDFEVLDIREYQALSPTSPYSDFIDVLTGEQINVSTLFNKVYQGPFHITLQTCVAKGQQDSWGRLFLLAPPLP